MALRLSRYHLITQQLRLKASSNSSILQRSLNDNPSRLIGISNKSHLNIAKNNIVTIDYSGACEIGWCLLFTSQIA